MKRYLFLIFLLFFSCASKRPHTVYLEEKKVLFTSRNLFPQGMDYSARSKMFYLTSLTKGNVYKLSESGGVSLAYKSTAFKSSIGIKLDETRKRLLVTNGDPGYAYSRDSQAKPFKTAGLVVFDLGSGKVIKVLDFTTLFPKQDSMTFYPNSIDVLNDGTILVADSKSASIYAVDPDYNISIFSQSPQFLSKDPENPLNLTGITSNDKYVFVLNSNTGKLFRIEIKTKNLVEVPSPITIKSGSNLIINKDKMYITNSELGYVTQVNISTGYSEIRPILDVDLKINKVNSYPTSVAISDNILFVLNSHLNILFSKGGEDRFSISEIFIKGAL